MTSLTFDLVAKSLIEESDWIFAKTMPQWPHHYTLRKNWRSVLDFEEVVQFIRDHGYAEKFHRSWYTRLDVNGLKYWSMGAPLPITILINRAVIDAPSPYDDIASIYDDLWSSPWALSENEEVIQAVGYTGGSVLDIGCGTGLFLDYVKPDEYLGIDPSREMLARLLTKHPGAETICTTFESFYTPRRFDLIVGLFASPSYITPSAFARLPAKMTPGGRYFLMFYRPGYVPETHKAVAADLPFHCHDPLLLPGQVSRIGNFDVVQGCAW